MRHEMAARHDTTRHTTTHDDDTTRRRHDDTTTTATRRAFGSMGGAPAVATERRRCEFSEGQADATRPPWRKILWEQQPYPDNYVDQTFLASVLTYTDTTQYELLTLIKASAVVTQQLSTVAIFRKPSPSPCTWSRPDPDPIPTPTLPRLYPEPGRDLLHALPAQLLRAALGGRVALPRARAAAARPCRCGGRLAPRRPKQQWRRR